MRTLILGALLSCCALLSSASTDKDYDAGLQQLNAGEYSSALRSFGRSAREGNTDAQYQIGLIYMDGLGVSSNAEEAAYWFRKAAQNGHSASQFEIGHCFAVGEGVQQDSRIAAEWYWRAAEQGDPDAAFYLARMYRDGVGMGCDLEKARYWYKKAADAGIDEATQELEQLPAPKVIAKAPAHRKHRSRK